MDKTFLLQTKDGETISKTESTDLEEAVMYFSGVKGLKPKDLLKIYKVVLDND